MEGGSVSRLTCSGDSFGGYVCLAHFLGYSCEGSQEGSIINTEKTIFRDTPMDYNDNDFQSQNLKLAGEGSTKFPPVLRPYALPKFDFDDSLHGHLRFDSLVETEVFLGIESNEDNQWIDEFSRGSSGIEFRTSAAESCSISRHNNVWSEATSSESVEMLLKSVGQEENIPGKTIFRESDACDELGCLIKQMERGSKNGDTSLSKAGDAIDVQPTLPQNEVLGNFSGSKEDVVGGQPLVAVTSQKNECETSVDGGLSDPISDTVNEKGILPTANENNLVDEMKVDTFAESLSGRTEEDSAASRKQFDSISTSAQITNISIGELNGQEAQHLKNDISENVDVLLTEKGEQGLDFVPEAEMIGSEFGCPGGNVTEGSTDIVGEPSKRMLKSDLVKGSNEDVQVGKSGNQVLLKEFEIGDLSKVNIHEASSVAFEHDSSFERPGVEVSSADDSETPLLLVKKDKVSEGKGDGSSSSCVGNISTLNVECSAAELLSESPVALTSKGLNDDSGIHREDSNAEVNVSSYIQGGSTKINEENVVTKQTDVRKCDEDISVDVKETTEFPSDSSNIDREVGGCLIIDKGVGPSSLGQSSKADELVVSQSHTDTTAGDESALENVDLGSHNTWKGVQSDSSDVVAEEAALVHQRTEGTKEMEGCPAVPGSTRGFDGAEAQIISEKFEEVIVKENYEKTSSKVSDAEPIPKNSAKLTQPLEELPSAAVQNGQEDNQDMLVSEDKSSCGQIDVPHIDGEPFDVINVFFNQDIFFTSLLPLPLLDRGVVLPCAGIVDCVWEGCGALKIHEGSISSTPLSESDAKFCAVERGSSGADLDKPTCGSPTVIRAAEVSLSESEKKVVKGSTGQSIPVSEGIDGDANKLQSVSPDLKGNDASKGEKSFTFEVSSLADSSEREAGKSWQPFSTIQVTTVLPRDLLQSSGIGQLNSSTAQDVSHGGLRMSDKGNVRSGSKGTSERKTRRASNKGMGKDGAKKGNAVKDTTPLRQSEKGDKTNNVSLSPSGIGQLVQSSELQHYGHVDSSSMKPFGVLATSASTLPDLNTSSSAVFQQPFTDLQQVQLRAQIFVYGALIQGTAPDEAYMISAFGGPDGRKSIWETAWRACMERLHGQKSLLNNAETPLQSRPGARATDQAIKHVANQGKVSSSPLGRSSSKDTPPIINPMIPLSSPLWSIPTPSADSLQSGGIPRSAVMDYQQALSPLHPHQTPPLRNFVGHNTSWISQAPFRGTWVAPPQSSAFDTNARFPVFPITETVNLTPLKEPSVPHSSGVKHVTSGPTIQSVSAANVFPGPSPLLDPRKGTQSPGQRSTEPKSRKRKKAPVSEESGQVIMHSQSQTESVSVPIVTSLVSTSVAIATPASVVSKASTEKVIMPLSPSISTGHVKKGDRETHQRATLSEETLSKLKEARTQAEDAAAFAAAAVSQNQEIWKQLEKQKNSGLVLDVESKLASAAAAIAAAAAVAKAAAAAANVASGAAMQAKLMADEALDSSGYGDSSQSNASSLSDSVKDLGKATPASILKGEKAISASSSVIFAAREAARRQVEAASAASKRAENMDAIVKAAELAAEAVSQAGKIVAMGDPLPLSDLIEAGLEGYLKVPQASTRLILKSNNVNGEKANIDNTREGPDTSAKNLKELPLGNREMHTTNQGKSPTLREISEESFEGARLVDGFSGSVAVSGKGTKGHKGGKASDLAKNKGVVPETETGSRSPSISIQIEHEKEVEPSKENSIKEGSQVEVFKEGVQLKAGWFTANVLSLKDGKAYVCYSELTSEEGSEKLKEWVVLNGEGAEAPKIRIARPITAMPFEGTRKRRRAAMGEYTWSIGDRVDAWMGDSWREGVVTEKSKKDETSFTVHFQVQGETSTLRAWNLRPSLIWRDGEWVEWSASTENNRASHEGDTPQEKRPRLGNPAVESKGKDKMLKGIGIMESRKPDEPTLLDLSTSEKIFNIGKNTRDENKPDTLRMIRAGLQKEGSGVVFGVPKPGKKRKFMDVSKHYVVNQASKSSGANDSVKFTKYLMPQGQASGSRGWKNASRTEPKEKRAAVSKPKVHKSGKPPSVSGRSILQKDNFVSSSVSAPDDGVAVDHMAKIKDSTRHVDTTSGKNDLTEFQSMSTSEGAPEGKLAPAGGKLTKIEEDKVFGGNSAKSASELVEPRRSNRRIQPTSRLLEGLQSSLIISKIPSVSHDKSHKSQNRNMPKRE
ncbi:hypothetical protein Patl1_18472 [Pistacia atlantica]|uniref:Uncharacterized protein n=1 Tax=Pistacia atlantica TaxID=434234 RepID=A0ACC1C0U9_9ROSI|nr:hypothetical protein Patl1_18472 [Pistacia atlantica]